MTAGKQTLFPDAETESESELVTPDDESPIAALERIGLEDGWVHGYWPTRGFAG